MIISNSNVSMSSRRDYSKTEQKSSISNKKLSNEKSYFIAFNYQKDTKESSTFYSENSSLQGGSDNSGTYNRQGLNNLDTQKNHALFGNSHNNLFPNNTKSIFSDNFNKLNENNDDSLKNVTNENANHNRRVNNNGFRPYITAQKARANESIGESLDRLHRRIYNSIMELLDLLRFRGGFSENLLNSTRNDGTNCDNNYGSALAMTNSTTPNMWSVTNSYSSYTHEIEETLFSTTGTAITADGRSIEFNLNISMSREFTEYTEISYATNYGSILTDPLVINLDDSPVSISDKTFYFDLDGDGNKEKIAKMNSSSGYLALDLNEDGVINDGSELFGTKTGNGFTELSAYDSDHNGWIDEADEVYSKLKVWVKSEDGTDKLLSLKEANVGAIYLDNAPTSFSLKNDTNNLVGQVRSSGMYLHEDGSVGSIQQVDF